MAALVVLTTVPDLKTARFLAKTLVTKKAAACVSFREGFISTYRWKGKLEQTREVMLVIKTTRKNFSKIKNLIIKHHPYSVPEIVGIPVNRISSSYSAWLEKSVK